MIKTIFKTLFKVLLSLGIVYAAVRLVCYWQDQQSDYIEIYNNQDDLEGDFDE